MSGGLWFVVGWILGSVLTALALALVLDRDAIRDRRLEAGTEREPPADE